MLTHVSRDNIALFKRSLRTIWASVSSSHADEAIAAYCGFRTYAALLAALPATKADLVIQSNAEAMLARLAALGHRLPASDVDRIRRLFISEMMGKTNRELPPHEGRDGKRQPALIRHHQKARIAAGLAHSLTCRRRTYSAASGRPPRSFSPSPASLLTI